MTKQQLVDLVSLYDAHELQEQFYLENGPGKHEQEDYLGVAVVKMNVSLLHGWLSEHDEDLERDNLLAESAAEAFSVLPKIERREVWEKSDFHYGIMGYKQKDADFYWDNEEK